MLVNVFLDDMKQFFGLPNRTIILSIWILFVFLLNIQASDISNVQNAVCPLAIHLARIHQTCGNSLPKNGMKNFGTSQTSKQNHPEKTIHPCQYPIELIERCVLALTNEDDWNSHPYCGVGSALIAALKK